jgi:deoxyribose-phosphate aldolase
MRHDVAQLERLLPVRVMPVDAVMLEQRAAALAGRSLKREAKLAALDLAIRCTDFTTLEGSDTPGKIAQLCAKAIRPDPSDAGVPSVAAVCVYPAMVPEAVHRLRGSGVAVASVAGSFPAGLGPIDTRLREIAWVVEQGASEVDIVLNRSAFLSGAYGVAFDEIAASKDAARDAHLKVILETGELGSYDQVRKASMLAMAAGADFIKTSTGKIGTAATLPVALCMAESIRDYAQQSGRSVGLKVAGGIRTAKQSWQYLVVVQETLGAAWLDPRRFRIGASSLLNELLLQRRTQQSARYQSLDSFTDA